MNKWAVFCQRHTIVPATRRRELTLPDRCIWGNDCIMNESSYINKNIGGWGGNEVYLVARINNCSPCSRTFYISANQLAEAPSPILLDWLEFRSWSDRDYNYLS
jgi:hypothetical protein